jgi:hypothetical protein
MNLDPDLVVAYLDHAFMQMLTVADRLGDERVNERPLGPTTNAVAPLIVHCCGVTEFWLGHVTLGRPSTRDRAREFETTATVAELRALVDATATRARADLAAIGKGEAGPPHPARSELIGGSEEEASATAALHVLEELYQHLGHMELAADALLG